MTNPTAASSADQAHGEDPQLVPPSQPAADTPAGSTRDPDDPTAGAGTHAVTDRPQAGVPERAVPEAPAADGTSEAVEPVQGVHTPDVGPGGEQFDTGSTPLPGRTQGSR